MTVIVTPAWVVTDPEPFPELLKNVEVPCARNGKEIVPEPTNFEKSALLGRNAVGNVDEKFTGPPSAVESNVCGNVPPPLTVSVLVSSPFGSCTCSDGMNDVSGQFAVSAETVGANTPFDVFGSIAETEMVDGLMNVIEYVFLVPIVTVTSTSLSVSVGCALGSNCWNTSGSVPVVDEFQSVSVGAMD